MTIFHKKTHSIARRTSVPAYRANSKPFESPPGISFHKVRIILAINMAKYRWPPFCGLHLVRASNILNIFVNYALPAGVLAIHELEIYSPFLFGNHLYLP